MSLHSSEWQSSSYFMKLLIMCVEIVFVLVTVHNCTYIFTITAFCLADGVVLESSSEASKTFQVE